MHPSHSAGQWAHLLLQGRFQLMLQFIPSIEQLPPRVVLKQLRVDAGLAQESGLSGVTREAYRPLHVARACVDLGHLILTSAILILRFCFPLLLGSRN